MKKELFAESIRNEIKSTVEGMLLEGDKIKFIITGEDMKHVYNRIALNPVTNLVPMGLGSNPIVTKSQEYMRLFFTERGIVAVGLDYYRQPLNYEVIEYSEIKSTVVHDKDEILEINTLAGERLAITLVKERKSESIKKLQGKLDLKVEKTRFQSKSRKVFNLEVVGGLVIVALIIIIGGAKLFLVG